MSSERVRTVEPVKLIVGLITSFSDNNALYAALEKTFGKITAESPPLAFDFTDYYEKEMGAGLVRRWVCFAGTRSPDFLAAAKNDAIALEKRFSLDGLRTANIDPGYISPAKLVLASTKDFSHRIYLGAGIYAETTLVFSKGDFRPLPWTYPDYRGPAFLEFARLTRRELLSSQRS